MRDLWQCGACFPCGLLHQRGVFPSRDEGGLNLTLTFIRSYFLIFTKLIKRNNSNKKNIKFGINYFPKIFELIFDEFKSLYFEFHLTQNPLSTHKSAPKAQVKVWMYVFWKGELDQSANLRDSGRAETVKGP